MVRKQGLKRLTDRQARHRRVRKKVSGTPERLRLNVFRSAAHIYAQVIDDTKGHTVAAASSVEPVVRTDMTGKTKLEKSIAIGHLIAQRAREAGVTKVAFDRGGYLYHGRVKAVAEAAREGGLEF